MSRLDELIAKLCPNGVKYKTLGEISSIITKQTGFDYTNTIKESLELEKKDDNVPYIQTKFFTRKQFDFKTDFYVPNSILEKYPKITLDEKCILFSIVGASIGNVGLFPGEPKAFLGGAICVLKVLPEYDIDFIYYCVESRSVQYQIKRKIKGAGQATITVEDIRNFVVPVPPLEVQHEIVRVLDNFTFLTAELTAELTARKKQYEYYRNKLLTFNSEVSGMKLREICNISRGKVISKEDIRDNPGNYPVYSSQTENNGELGKISSYMYDGEYLTWTTDGANAGSVFYRKGKFNITNVCGLLKVVKPQINIRYLFHLLTVEAPKYVSRGMGNPKLMSNVIGNINLVIPPLEVQNRVANILDYFVVICSDLKVGLPAEIAARQKQYEYYRDKLLTFEEEI